MGTDMIHREPWYKEAGGDLTRQRVLRRHYDQLAEFVKGVYRKGDWRTLVRIGEIIVDRYLEGALAWTSTDHPEKPRDQLFSLRSYLSMFSSDLMHRYIGEQRQEDGPSPEELWDEQDWETLYGKILKVLPLLQELDQARAKYTKDDRTVFDFLRGEKILT